MILCIGASTKIGEFTASGFLFKDSVEIVTVEDPEVEGVTVYISDFKRSLPDKLKKNFFSEPSQVYKLLLFTQQSPADFYMAIAW